MGADAADRFSPVYGAAEAVASGVRRLTARNSGPLTFTGTNTYLLGSDEITVIDPGPDDREHVADIVVAAGAPIRRIVVTHDHSDHSGAVPHLVALTGAEVVGAAPAPSAMLPYRPDRVIADGEEVATGAGRLRAIATPGHTAGHLCFELVDSGWLFSGDHVMAWSTSLVVPPDGRMADYMASLGRLAQVYANRYWPAHGGPVDDGRARVEALRNHRLGREAAILRAVDSAARSVEEIVTRVYIGLDPRLTRAAAQSVSAHLDWLVERDLIRRDATRFSRR